MKCTSEILTPIYSSYYATFKLIVIKYAEESNTSNAACKFHATEQNVR
jgi:hypothetical protein